MVYAQNGSVSPPIPAFVVKVQTPAGFLLLLILPPPPQTEQIPADAHHQQRHQMPVGKNAHAQHRERGRARTEELVDEPIRPVQNQKAREQLPPRPASLLKARQNHENRQIHHRRVELGGMHRMRMPRKQHAPWQIGRRAIAAARAETANSGNRIAERDGRRG